MTRRTVAIAAAVLIIAGGVLLVVLWPRHAPVAAHTETVRYGAFESTLPASGTIEHAQTRTFTALVAGNLDHFAVVPGERVRAGALLVSIANTGVVEAEETAYAAYLGAAARARGAVAANRVLPTQNRSAVVSAEANLEQARFAENQARADARAGAQSGLGYGAPSAAEQKAQSDATLAKATTDAREAERIMSADQELYANKAIAHDALDQSVARNDQAQAELRRAQVSATETNAAISRQAPVLNDRVLAAEDAVKQALAALAAARATATEPRQSDVDAAIADEAARHAEWQAALLARSALEVRTPVDGTIETTGTEPGDATRPLQPGDAIAAGIPLVTLASDNHFVVRVKVDEQDVAGLRAGQPAWVHGVDFGGRRLAATVAALNAVAQKSDDPANASRQIVVTVRLLDAPAFVRAGMTADVDIVVEHDAHVLTLEPAAILRDAANAPYVFVVHDGVAHKAPVTLGPANADAVVVRAGVTSGERIVTEHIDAIVDGAAVTGS
jgi:HlyD family secretion protein